MRWANWTESIWVYRSYTDIPKICWDQNFDLGFCYFEIENCENFPILDWEKWSKFPNYCEIITSTIIPISIPQISMLQFAFYDELSKSKKLWKKWNLRKSHSFWFFDILVSLATHELEISYKIFIIYTDIYLLK